MDLEQLIKGCKRQSLKSQSILYERYKDDLYVLCLKYCSNKEEAQDNLQDAFIEIFSKIKNFKAKGSFEGWIKRITIHKAIDKYKKSKKQSSTTIDDNIHADHEVEPEMIASIPLNTILEQIQSLPPKYRLVFNLFELDGYSHKEIAELLGVSTNTSKSNLHRAKHLLKTKLSTALISTSYHVSNEY